MRAPRSRFSLGWLMLPVAYVAGALAAFRIHVILGCILSGTLALAWITSLLAFRLPSRETGRPPGPGLSAFLRAACVFDAIPVVVASSFVV